MRGGDGIDQSFFLSAFFGDAGIENGSLGHHGSQPLVEGNSGEGRESSGQRLDEAFGAAGGLPFMASHGHRPTHDNRLNRGLGANLSDTVEKRGLIEGADRRGEDAHRIGLGESESDFTHIDGQDAFQAQLLGIDDVGNRLTQKFLEQFARLEMGFAMLRNVNDFVGFRVARFWLGLGHFHFEHAEITDLDAAGGAGFHESVAQGVNHCVYPGLGLNHGNVHSFGNTTNEVAFGVRHCGTGR